MVTIAKQLTGVKKKTKKQKMFTGHATKETC